MVVHLGWVEFSTILLERWIVTIVAYHQYEKKLWILELTPIVLNSVVLSVA